ncbi:MAG TPA: hypothetical protein VLL05_02015 [Terriglobales bacterium]|nr:hypothetical protein [Terriglobales bacterium]
MPIGAVTDRDGRLVSCHRAAGWGNLAMTSELLGHVPASLKPDWEAGATQRLWARPTWRKQQPKF